MTENAQPGATTDPAAGDQAGSGQDVKTEVKADAPQEIMVPVNVVKALRDENATLKNENALYKAQQSMTRGFTPQPATQPTQPVQAADPFEGMGDNDVMTVADVKKIVKSIQPPKAGPDPTILSRMEKIELSLQDPNYEATIRTHLPQMLNSNPAMAPMIMQQIQNAHAIGQNPVQVALMYARMSPSFIASQGGGAADGGFMSELDRILANQDKPGAAAGAGAGGALSLADRFTNMSDEEFAAHEKKVLSGQA